MAYRRTSNQSSWRTLKPSQVLPIWTTANSNAANLVAKELLAHLGVTDIRSYWHQLRIPIAISVIVCTLVGASNYGLKGVFLGGLLGLAAPAALLLLGVTLVVVVIYLAIYCFVWAVILCVLWWLLHS
jgi:hypothetical protein